MKEKKLILMGLLLSGVTCLTVVMAGSSLSNNQTFNAVRSTSGEYEIIMNKDTLYQDYCYSESGFRSQQYAFFQMNNPGNYAAIDDYSFYTCIYGGEHLYTITIGSEGKGINFRIDVRSMRSSVIYFDEAKNRQIYIPGFKDGFYEIELTVSDQSDIQFNSSVLETGEKVTQNGNTYTITNIVNNRTSFSLFDFTSTSKQVGKKLIIDQVVLRYTCESIN